MLSAGFFFLAALLLTAGGCRTHHVVETYSEVKPIHITIDVNVRVDDALDNFFSDLDDNETPTPSEKTPTEDTI